MTKLQMDCLIAAIKTKSLSKAAKQLYMSVQSVSQHIRNLEDEIGFPLLVRKKQGVFLTDKGMDFYSRIVHWLGLWDNTQKKIQEHYEGLSDSFRIGISEYVDVLGKISSGLAAFRNSYPDVHMSGQQNKHRVLLEEIEKGNLDVAILNEKQITTGADFEFHPFAKEDLRLYLSGIPKDADSSLWKVSSPELKAACSNMPHISTSYGAWNDEDWEEISRRMSVSLGYDFSRHYEAVNFRSAVLNLNVIPCSVIQDARFGYPVEGEEIVSIPLETESWLCCLWHRKNENPLIRIFVDHLETYYR